MQTPIVATHFQQKRILFLVIRKRNLRFCQIHFLYDRKRVYYSREKREVSRVLLIQLCGKISLSHFFLFCNMFRKKTPFSFRAKIKAVRGIRERLLFF